MNQDGCRSSATRPREVDYRAAIRRALEAAKASAPPPEHPEVIAARGRELLAVPPADRPTWLASRADVARLPVCRWLIEQAEALRETHPGRLLDVAEAAVDCAQAMDYEPRTLALIADTRSEAWVANAMARRVAGDLRAADEACQRAEFHLVFGSGDPMLKGKLLSFRASLLIEQRRVRKAIELLEEARGLHRSIADQIEEAKTLLLLARAYRIADRYEDAVSAVVTAARQAEGERGRHLRLYAFHNLALYLEEMDRPEQALEILERSEPLYQELAGELLLLRRRWVSGRLAARLGNKAEAEETLDAVRRELTALEMPLDAALATLDLAVLYAGSGRPAEVERLATEAYPIFVSSDIPREATAALLLFAQSARSRTATAASITALAARLRKLDAQRG